MPRQRFGHGARHRVADDRHRVDALALGDLPHQVGVEARDQHDLVAPVEADEDRQLRGTVDQRRDRELHDLRVARERVLRDLLRLLDRIAERVAAAHPGEEQVFLAPHDALGHAGRAARVDDEQVVAGARLEVARIRLRANGRFVFDRADRRQVRVSPADREQRLQLRHIGLDRGDPRCELSLV